MSEDHRPLRCCRCGFDFALAVRRIAPPSSRSTAPSAVKGALEDLAPKFEKATGDKLAITWRTDPEFTKKAQEGDVPARADRVASKHRQL